MRKVCQNRMCKGYSASTKSQCRVLTDLTVCKEYIGESADSHPKPGFIFKEIYGKEPSSLKEMHEIIANHPKQSGTMERALEMACDVIHSTKCNILFKEECPKIAQKPNNEVKGFCSKCRKDYFISKAQQEDGK